MSGSHSEPPRVAAQKLWMGLTAALLLAIVAAGGFYIWRQTPEHILATAPLDADCDLRAGFCESRLPNGGRIAFSIRPQPVVGMKPLKLRVRTAGLDAQAVEVDFRGLGMNMGFNRPRLRRDAEGEYSGIGVLALCILDRMAWEARVLVHTPAGIYAAPFRFESLRQ